MADVNDPRYVRVRAQLNDAALRLALAKPADAITVAELSREAGISRTTFYQHGDSPAQFIADAVVDILQPFLDELTGAIATASDDYLLRWREIYIRMLTELLNHRQILGALFGGEGQPVIVGHITRRLTLTFAAYVDEFKSRLEGESVSELWTEMASTQQVYNLVSVLVSWLSTGMKESPDVVVNTYLSLAPPWQLARFQADGSLSLRRSRLVSDIVAEAYNKPHL
ncbi:TetR/AcrR family transcriptional regulator [Trueperella pecoris]|uniref:TetR/AcrR family transcriptional regulator n=1 Tax=Trueperella pecoris TaxID=2733571 RepID=A0A7M1QWY3_9ACTO|nr:TetR/AcrR family transcriptional regulator [Trueperella pecoris]QOQ39523.1 TetR/AcrR family transcriptional regulator [Trueperella pecoris]QOR45855.1 TetR/AcrR family transcriptional regulator [Trueperella pecoris]QTG75683.1 TetR/AcrR family transcriptional regulator [Trueperella pecoris]